MQLFVTLKPAPPVWPRLEAMCVRFHKTITLWLYSLLCILFKSKVNSQTPPPFHKSKNILIQKKKRNKLVYRLIGVKLWAKLESKLRLALCVNLCGGVNGVRLRNVCYSCTVVSSLYLTLYPSSMSVVTRIIFVSLLCPSVYHHSLWHVVHRPGF